MPASTPRSDSATNSTGTGRGESSASESSSPSAPRASLPRRVTAWVLRSIWLLALGLFQIVVVLWTTLALYYSNLPFPTIRLLMAIAFACIAVWALVIRRTFRWRSAVALLVVGMMIWWSFIHPSHDRPWRKEVAVMPQISIDGDRMTVLGVRNFVYRSRDDFDVAYETRVYDLRHLSAVDFFVSDWGLGIVGHTFLSFCFDNAPPLCISIEIRPEIGEGFAPVASMFKQLELIYIVGDERDIVGVRTKHRGETVFLHRVRTSPPAARRLLEVYAERINELYKQAEWYNLLSNNCSLNIARYANAAGREGRLDWRFLVNGLMDRYLFAAGIIDTSMPFDELRRRAMVNDAANAAIDAPDFSRRIRVGIPGIPPTHDGADAPRQTALPER